MNGAFLYHLHNVHALYDGNGLVLCCDQGGCPCTFNSFNSYTIHNMQQDLGYQFNGDEVDDNVEDRCDAFAEDRDNEISDGETFEEGTVTFQDQLKRQTALFVGVMLSEKI